MLSIKEHQLEALCHAKKVDFKNRMINLLYDRVATVRDLPRESVANIYDYVKSKANSFEIYSEKGVASLLFAYVIVGTSILEDVRVCHYLQQPRLAESDRIDNFLTALECSDDLYR